MHFSLTGNNYGVVGDRVPGIWLYPKSTMIHIPQDAGTTINQHRAPTKALLLNTPYHVKVRSVGSQVKVYLNDEWYYTHNIIGNKPSGAAHVFMADPWYAPANVQISNVVYEPCPSPENLLKATNLCDRITLEADPGLIEFSNYLGLVTVNADYEIEFNLTINALTPSWGNILHFTTTNNNMANNGDRIPGVWLYPNAAKLLVAQDFDTQANVATPMGATISIGEPHYIKIVAVGQKIRTYVDNVLYSTITNSNLRTKGVANVYIGDPWHTPADAWISKVYYNPCPTPFKYLEPSNTCDLVNVFSGSTAIEQNTLLGSVNVLGDYAIEFDLTINGIVDGWANILHLTQSVRSVGSTVKIYLNDNWYYTHTLIGEKPTGIAHLFASDPWYAPANVLISNIVYNPCPSGPKPIVPSLTCDLVTLLKEPSQLENANLLGNIYVHNHYAITFDLVINGVVPSWGSILHITQDGNNDKVGDRIPGIWLYPGDTKLLVSQDSFTSRNQFGTPGVSLDIGKLYMIRVEIVDQTVTVFVNSNVYYQRTISGDRPNGYAKVFVADPWHTPANAIISNVYYSPQKCVRMCIA
ncbi:hypothetical protein BC833DRAFT_566137 [Globomyces pollinis-pini]|nr:hypothetical protein BC833DRAFT_566137 [Globomyces pollinis-pini]